MATQWCKNDSDGRPGGKDAAPPPGLHRANPVGSTRSTQFCANDEAGRHTNTSGSLKNRVPADR